MYLRVVENMFEIEPKATFRSGIEVKELPEFKFYILLFSLLLGRIFLLQQLTGSKFLIFAHTHTEYTHIKFNSLYQAPYCNICSRYETLAIQNSESAKKTV